MSEREKLWLSTCVVGGVVVLLGVLSWNLVAGFRHECRAGASRLTCVICGAGLPVASPERRENLRARSDLGLPATISP
jgi:hypothetical protein